MLSPSSPLVIDHTIGHAIIAALAFESLQYIENNSAIKSDVLDQSRCSNTDEEDVKTVDDVDVHQSEKEEEEVFYDAFQSSEEIASEEIVNLLRGGTHQKRQPLSPPPPPPPPPLSAATNNKRQLPLRFLRAGKGDPIEGERRYEQTLEWRKNENVDGILYEPQPYFHLIKQHYPHYFHLRGKNNEPLYIEKPARTNLRALREGGVDLKTLLRHYTMVTEFCWQFVEDDDFAQSIYIIDLEGIKMTDFVGESVDFVRKASQFTSQHYPERAGYVMVINVPSWFKLIWNVVKPMVDPVTLKKIYILRGKEEIFQAMLERVPIENIPREYGGKSSMPLGQSPEEEALRLMIEHNNDRCHGRLKCGGPRGSPPCQFCTFVPSRSY